MAQIRGTAGYHLGSQQNQFNPASGYAPGPSSMGGRGDATNDPSPLEAIRAQTSKIEDWLDTLSDPLKPYLPAIGRFLIVVTFLEDALRIITQWNDQLVYLHDYRHSEYSLSSASLHGRTATPCEPAGGGGDEILLRTPANSHTCEQYLAA